MHRLVFDTSAILNFGKRGDLDFLLEKLAADCTLLLPPEVERELLDPDNRDFYATFLKRRFTVQAVQNIKLGREELAQLSAVLGSGEINVILLADELEATAVLDDVLARKAALKMKIKVVGTLGILSDAIKNKWCTDDQCIEIVGRLHANGFRIRKPGANESFAEYFASLMERTNN